MPFKLNGKEVPSFNRADLHNHYTIDCHVLGATFKQYPIDRKPDSSGRIVPDLTRYVIHRTCTYQQIENHLPNTNSANIIRGSFTFHFFEIDDTKPMRIVPLKPSV